MKKILVVALLACSVLPFKLIASQESNKAQENAGITDKSTARQRLIHVLSTLKNLSAHFNQSILDVDGNIIQQGNGHFVLAKPDLVKWQTIAPDESTITSDGETLWLFDPFIEQVTAYSLAKSIANTPILLLTSSDENLWQQYNIKQLNTRSFNVVAKDSNAQVRQLTLTFNQGILSEFIIHDATGQQSHFILSDIVVNQVVDTAIFQFELPEGVLLDDQR